MALNKLPRFAGDVNGLPKRSKFLDGTSRAFFAPGQQPNMLATLFPAGSVGIGENLGSDNYVNPTDWLLENMLLRPPQVVWIDVSVYDAGETTGGLFSRNGHISREDFLLAEIDQANLVANALEVKTLIEAVRHHRTWINVVNHADHGLIEHSYFLGDGSWQDCGSYPMMVPSSRDNWFGTDFLGIWLGDHVYSATQSFADDLTMGTYYAIPDQIPLELTPDQIAANPVSQVIKHRLFDNHAKFFRYAARLFDHGIANAADSGVTPFNPTPSTIFDEHVAWGVDNHVDIKHPNNTGIISADYLLDLITSHFGFDREGRDL